MTTKHQSHQSSQKSDKREKNEKETPSHKQQQQQQESPDAPLKPGEIRPERSSGVTPDEKLKKMAEANGNKVKTGQA